MRKHWLLLCNNPFLFGVKVVAKIRFILLSLGVRLNVNPRRSVSFGPVKLELDARDPYMRRMLVGAYELEVRSAIQKHLGEGGVFIDVGASIGYYSALASNLVGPSGQVHSFEPVPAYFSALKNLADHNPLGNIVAHQVALGEGEATATIYVSKDDNIGWNTIIPGFMKSDVIGEQLAIPVIRLDDYLIRNNVHNVTLIKIDVEGFEYPVLKGLEHFLAIERPLIVCEVTPIAHSLLGHDVRELFGYLASFSYRAYTLHTGKEEQVSVGQLSLSEQYDLLFKPCNL